MLTIINKFYNQGRSRTVHTLAYFQNNFMFTSVHDIFYIRNTVFDLGFIFPRRWTIIGSKVTVQENVGNVARRLRIVTRCQGYIALGVMSRYVWEDVCIELS